MSFHTTKFENPLRLLKMKPQRIRHLLTSDLIRSIKQCVANDWLGLVLPHPTQLIAQSDWMSDGQQHINPVYCPTCGANVGPGEVSRKETKRQRKENSTANTNSNHPEQGYEWRGGRCADCRNRRLGWDSLTRLGQYQGDLRKWIHLIKFSRWDAMGKHLGMRLGQAIAERQIQPDIIVPMPSTLRRKMVRGIDHAAVIASGVSRAIKCPVIHPIRKLPRPPQRAVAASKRRDNVRKSIRLQRWHSLDNLHVLLVDDIATTRSTLIEATRVLQRQGNAATVSIAVLAVVDHRRSDIPPQTPVDTHEDATL